MHVEDGGSFKPYGVRRQGLTNERPNVSAQRRNKRKWRRPHFPIKN